MRIKSYFVAGILVLLVLIIGYSLSPQRNRDRSGDKYFRAQQSKDIGEDARQAKQKRVSEIYVAPPKVTWAEAENIDAILRTDSVVFAKLDDKESTFYDNDKTAIVTWLRFEVIDHIAGPPVPGLPAPSNVPEKLKKNFSPSFNFFVRVFGGTLNQDGVKVISDGPFSELPVNGRFVLFVFFDNDAEQTLGGFNFGPESVVPIDNKGDLPTFSGASLHPISKFIKDNELGNLESLKASLRTRAKTLNR